MDMHLAEVSRTMEPAELGRRIRNARVAAGLTQTALAADEITPAYISRIEDGQRRPEFGLLGRLANRMGITLESLLGEIALPEQLAIELALDHAELSLAGGEAQAALEALDSIDAGQSAALDRRTRMVRAGALEAIGDLNGAIIELEDLCASPVQSAEWLRCLISLCRCYKETGELDKAIAVGENAQATILDLELEGLTESIQLSVTVAGAYMRRGDLEPAMRICRRALERADQIGSPLGKASAYWNASLIESRNGNTEVALGLAKRALTYFEIGDDGRNLARLRGHVADMQLELQPPDATGAIETLERAFAELDWSAGSPVDRASQLQTRARAHLLLGNLREARIDVEASLQIVPSHATAEQAYALAVLGEVNLSEGHIASARDALLSSVRILSASGADREVAQLWLKLATDLRAVGELEAALDAFSRAAASAGLAVPTTSMTTQLPLS
jgi:tetratricopeptide (TPR) repeat protein